MRCNFPWNSTRAANRGRRSPHARSEAGFTLIEVLVSALLVALIAATVAQALIATAHTSAEQRGRSQADDLAQQDQERLRGLSAQQLNGLNQNATCPGLACRTVTLDGIAFTVTSTAQFLDASSGASCSSGAAAYFRIVSSVDWTANQGRPPVVEESVITPPAGGTLLTQVQDQTGAPLSGVTVTASGPDTASGVTDSAGCTVLAALASGGYTVRLADTGYVDMDGNPSPLTRSATVTSTGTTTPGPKNPVKIGLAASLTGSFATGVSGATGEADALSWFGNGTSDTMSIYKATAALSTPATQISTTGLFPFAFTGPSYTGNYGVWAGRCRQQQPPVGYDRFNVSPGSNQTVPVQEPALGVTSVMYNTTVVKPGHVKLTFNSTGGSSCTYSWYPTITASASMPANGWLANPGQPFATTGSPASASGATQTGALSVCADYYTGPTYGWRNATAANVTNTSFTALNPVPTITIANTSTSGQC